MGWYILANIFKIFLTLFHLLTLHFKNFIEPIDSEFAQQTGHP